MRKTVVTLLAVFFVFSVSVASANVATLKAGSSADCLRASWNIENLSETKGTTVHMRMHMIRYLLDHLPPGPQ